MPFPWDRPRSPRMAVRPARSRRARLSDRAKTAQRRLAIEPLEERSLLAVIPSLVADIRPPATGGNSNPHEFVGANAGTFFAANDGTNGTELWVTQGDQSSTRQVKDIRQVPQASSSSNPNSLVNLGGTLFFVANDGANGDELWRSDGTATGTQIVKDIYGGSVGSSPTALTVVGNTLYFYADDGVHGEELWATDGTPGNTRLVKDIAPDYLSSGGGDLVGYKGKLYFAADDGTNGAELWRSDGTEAGTVLVKDINVGSGPSYPFYFTESNGTLFFVADDGVTGTELWKTDGTFAGTVLVADIYGGEGYSSNPYALTDVGGTLFFYADDGLHGFELWKSNGTQDGTVLVRDINLVIPATDPFGPSDPSSGDYLTNYAGTLYFQATDGVHGAELWKSDGTYAGTVMVKDVVPGAVGSQPTSLIVHSSALFFTASDASGGFELWRSRGTADTTRQAMDIRPGPLSSTPQELAIASGSLYFSADDGTHGREPWYVGPNQAPTDVLLDPKIFPEDRPPPAYVGTFTTIDPDVGDEHTYVLPPGWGDNDKFIVIGNDLYTNESLPWQAAPLSILVETRDMNDASFDKQFSIDLGGIFVTPDWVKENEPVDTKVGDLSAVVGATPGTFNFTLYAAGDNGDNAFFTIHDGALYTNSVFNFEADNSYTVSIQAQGALGTFWTYETITINDLNEAPVAVNDLYSTPSETPLTVPAADGLLKNDYDPDVYWVPPQTLTVYLAPRVIDTGHAIVNLNADGSLVWTPYGGWLGGDTFTYQAVDNLGMPSNVATVRINAGPVVQDDYYSLDEFDVTTPPFDVPPPGVLANDTDYDGDPMTAEKLSDPVHGTVTFRSDGSFSYTPIANFFGSDSFTYRASDGNTKSTAATLHLTVRNVPDPPVALDDAYANLNDMVLTVPAPGVLGNDWDPDLIWDPTIETLTASVSELQQPASGRVVMNPDGLGGFTYTPNPGFTGIVTFKYQVTDHPVDTSVAPLTSNEATVTIDCRDENVGAMVGFDPIYLDVDPANAPNTISTFWEGQQTLVGAGWVSIDRSDPRLQGDFYVSLESSNRAAIKINGQDGPALVRVPAGASKAYFDVDVQDDNVINDNVIVYLKGLKSVTVTSNTLGLKPRTVNALVDDNEPNAFVVTGLVTQVDDNGQTTLVPANVPSPQLAGGYFPIAVTPKNIAGKDIPTLVAVVPIYATSDNGMLPVAVSGSANGVPFNGGRLTTTVAVLSAGKNVQLVVDDGLNHKGFSNRFQVTTGEMTKLDFSAIPQNQVVDLPFQVTITARDAKGYPAPDYNGPLYLSAWMDGGSAPSIVITEASDQSPDYVEIQNVSGGTGSVSVQGWKLVVNDPSSGNPNANSAYPLSGSMVAGEVRYSTDDLNDHYWGKDIAWGSSTAKGWVMLLDDTGTVRDFLAWGYSASEIQSIAAAVDGVPSPVHVGSAWSGPGVAYVGNNATSLQRWGNRDGNVASDFLWQAASKGMPNSVLMTPFAAATAVAINPPVTGNFVGGQWTGMVTIKHQAQNVFLWAADASGNSLASGRFNAAAANAGSGIGAYDPAASTFYLRCKNDSGNADYTFGYGEPGAGWQPIAGDWNGDGVDTVGLYDPKTSLFYLSNSNQSGFADVVIGFGPGGNHTLPVAGDWNGDGIDTIGIYDTLSSSFYLRNSNTTGMADLVFGYGEPGKGWLPVAGDWDNDGFAGVALYDPKTSLYYIKARLGSGYADVCFGYGEPGAGWRPFAGNWNNTGLDSVGVYDPARALYYERDSNTSGNADKVFGYGIPHWLPIAGDWNGPAALSAPAVAMANAAPIDAAQVQPVFAAALARWSATGLAPELVDRLRSVKLVVADLPDARLGRADGNTIYIDSNAAGYGWFVDPTPADDAEFTPAASTAQLTAIDPRAVDHMDLLTAVSHELGHVAGLDDLAASSDSLMAGVLSPGLRREPGAAEIDALLADPGHQDWL